MTECLMSRNQIINSSIVRPTLLYINSETVKPAKAGIQFANTGFRVKPGMTIIVKGLLTQYTRNFSFLTLKFDISNHSE